MVLLGKHGDAKTVQLTISSPTNIAVIKYWGKRDTKLNLPINSSVSLTLNQRDLRTVTTVTASTAYASDRLWLNGHEESVGESSRLLSVFREVRALAADLRDPSSGAVLVNKKEWAQMNIWVVSENNFPTAAGLASSAAGYAALAFALATLMGVPNDAQLSVISRQGSGSACRSLAGGFVAWDMGAREDGADSRARQVSPASHWPELQVLILVVSDAKKSVSSTGGMITSVATSPLLAHRAKAIVPGRMTEMEAAYRARDFAAVAKLSMQDSNQFHSTCLDTYPPIFYLNTVSRDVINMVHAFNEAAGEVRLGYTFDAGPNAVLIVQRKHVAQALAAVLKYFPPVAGKEAGYVNRPELEADAAKAALPPALAQKFPLAPQPGSVRYVYHTDVGDGAAVLPDTETLADPAGLPLATADAPKSPLLGKATAIYDAVSGRVAAAVAASPRLSIGAAAAAGAAIAMARK